MSETDLIVEPQFTAWVDKGVQDSNHVVHVTAPTTEQYALGSSPAKPKHITAFPEDDMYAALEAAFKAWQDPY